MKTNGVHPMIPATTRAAIAEALTALCESRAAELLADPAVLGYLRLRPQWQGRDTAAILDEFRQANAEHERHLEATNPRAWPRLGAVRDFPRVQERFDAAKQSRDELAAFEAAGRNFRQLLFVEGRALARQLADSLARQHREAIKALAAGPTSERLQRVAAVRALSRLASQPDAVSGHLETMLLAADPDQAAAGESRTNEVRNGTGQL